MGNQLHKSFPDFGVSFLLQNGEGLTLKGRSARSFPNPVPEGTRLPQWALLDVTVRYYPLYLRHELTTHASLRIVGAPTNRGPLVVGIIHSAFRGQLQTCIFSHSRDTCWSARRPLELLYPARRCYAEYLPYVHRFPGLEGKEFKYGSHRGGHRCRSSGSRRCCSWIFLPATAAHQAAVCRGAFLVRRGR